VKRATVGEPVDHRLVADARALFHAACHANRPDAAVVGLEIAGWLRLAGFQTRML